MHHVCIYFVGCFYNCVNVRDYFVFIVVIAVCIIMDEERDLEMAWKDFLIWSLALILWIICMFSFKTNSLLTFLTTLGKSSGITFGFLLVSYACDEDTWKDDEETEEISHDVQEKDPWILEYEEKYGPLEEEKEKNDERVTIMCTWPSGAITLGSSSYPLPKNCVRVTAPGFDS